MMHFFAHPPKSICVLRLSAIGDVCNVLAVVQQIQRHYPNIEITWIIGKNEFKLVENQPKIKFITVDKKLGWKGIYQLWKKLRAYRFDVLLNMQTALRASILSLGINARYKLGFGKKRTREWQSLFINRQIEDIASPHVVDGFLAFAQWLGIPPQKPTWNLYINEHDQQFVEHYVDRNRQSLIISPCSSKAEKDWLIERYAQVANIANRNDIHVIFTASTSPKEITTVEKILALCDFIPVNLSGKLTLTQLAALISQVDLLIAPDSGPVHIANAQGTPVIGLYAYHNPLRTGPYNNLDNVISVYEKNVLKEYGKPSNQLAWATKLKGKQLMAQIETKEVLVQMARILGIAKLNGG